MQLDTDEQIALLKETMIFCNLSDEEIAEVVPYVQWREFVKDTVVVRYKDTDTDMYILGKGSVRATNFTFDGKEILLQELKPSDSFGELSAIDSLPRTAHVITLVDCLIGVINRDDFWTLARRYPEVAASVMIRLADMVRKLSGRVYENSALDVKDRVRSELLRLARQNMNGANTAVIDKSPTHVAIANRINCHREAVTREFGDLKSRGLIVLEKRKLIFPDINGLADLLPEEF